MEEDESQGKEKNEEVSYGYSAEGSSTEEENKLLKETVSRLNEELSLYKAAPLIIGEIRELMPTGAIIRLKNGNEFFVNISKNCKKLKVGDFVMCEQKNLTVIEKLNLQNEFNVEKFVNLEKPTIGWDEIGGLDEQINDIKEVIELPLKKPELFKKVGIIPPKGVLLYGPPGTGKTLLAKAVAASTNSTFIEVVSSELVQKFIGEGAKLVKEIFQLAKEKAPSIIFIDELDALAATRIDVGTSGEREVQRTFMQLLAELDGFKPLGNVKVIGATNRKDILDPAIIRPGRLDRMVKVDLPNDEGMQTIFKIHTKNMKLDNVDVKKLIKLMKGFSGAEIKAVATEAGYFAIRDNRFKVNQKDFLDGIAKVKKEEQQSEEYKAMFG